MRKKGKNQEKNNVSKRLNRAGIMQKVSEIFKYLQKTKLLIKQKNLKESKKGIVFFKQFR